MSYMFNDCRNLKTLDLSNFDTSKVTTMSYMFSFCKFNPLNISNFDTSNVKIWLECFLIVILIH